MTAAGMQVQSGGADRQVRTIARAIEELNEDHAVVLVGDKPAILKESIGADGLPEFRVLSVAGFHEWMRPNTLKVLGRKTQVSKLWMNSTERRQYEGIVFAPGEERPQHYNLWRGYAVEPDPDAGTYDRLMEHLW